jgi:hypothetical protein
VSLIFPLSAPNLDGSAATVQMSIPASGGVAVEAIALLLLSLPFTSCFRQQC